MREREKLIWEGRREIERRIYNKDCKKTEREREREREGGGGEEVRK